jgi:hypothetical protein
MLFLFTTDLKIMYEMGTWGYLRRNGITAQAAAIPSSFRGVRYAAHLPEILPRNYQKLPDR